MAAVKRWTCDICGYIHEGDAPPAICPICGVDSDHFFETRLAEFVPRSAEGKWKCAVCGYIHEGDRPPATCPICSVPSEHFTAVDIPQGETLSQSAPVRLVIIGAGIAGMTAAETAAAFPFAKVTLISKEAPLPYYRLNLTRYLAGEVDAASLTMKPEDWFASHNVERIHGEVAQIDRSGQQVVLKDGSAHPYDRLLIAAGAHCFMPPIPGASKEGVYTLRTLADADAIMQKAATSKTALVIGGGLLGLEVAGALSGQGCNVTVLEGFGWLLPRQLPEAAGTMLIDILREKQIGVQTNAKTKEIVGDESVRGVLLEDGRFFDADFVVVSTGVRANSYLARQCGLTVSQGIVVDDELRTSDHNILAAGDVCEHRGVLYGIWPAGYTQGAIAAANAVGDHQKFEGIARSNRLKVLDAEVFSIGVIAPEDASTLVYEYSEGSVYRRLVVRDDILKGAVLVGDTTMAGQLQEAIDEGTHLSNWPSLRQAFPCLDTP